MPSKVKHLRFELTPKQYGDFWVAVAKLGESDKTPAFLKMINMVIKPKK